MCIRDRTKTNGPWSAVARRHFAGSGHRCASFGNSGPTLMPGMAVGRRPLQCGQTESCNGEWSASA
eukprot:6733070-Lingulodinium_polyedra.AAC.1